MIHGYSPRMMYRSNMMKIYLPFDAVAKNVTVMSELDLGHQRNCALTILESIAGKAKGWRWHPGVRMWYGQEYLLAHIAYATNEEWATQVALSNEEPRKSMDGLVKTYHQVLYNLGFTAKELVTMPTELPWWWGHKRFHEGEKAMLLRHDPDWYGQFFPKVDNGLCEWWPRQEKDQFIYGPQMGPNGDYDEYHLDDKPIYKAVHSMTDKDFAHHANTYHNLLPDLKTPISATEPIMPSLKALHDRFHQKRVYTTHDHTA